jgi:hypothetical protein
MILPRGVSAAATLRFRASCRSCLAIAANITTRCARPGERAEEYSNCLHVQQVQQVQQQVLACGVWRARQNFDFFEGHDGKWKKMYDTCPDFKIPGGAPEGSTKAMIRLKAGDRSAEEIVNPIMTMRARGRPTTRRREALHQKPRTMRVWI